MFCIVGFVSFLRRALTALGPSHVVIVSGLICSQAAASDDGHIGLPAYVVHSDYGGPVQDRLRELQTLTQSHQRVEIRGEVCYSSCTMLLGLEHTCVSPTTVFGFHGPSRNGMALPRDVFDRVSTIISSHYPLELQTWYMSVARYELENLYRVTGSELIKLGAVESCDTTYASEDGSIRETG